MAYLVNSRRRRDGAAEVLSGLEVACAGGSGCGGRTAQRYGKAMRIPALTARIVGTDTAPSGTVSSSR